MKIGGSHSKFLVLHMESFENNDCNKQLRQEACSLIFQLTVGHNVLSCICNSTFGYAREWAVVVVQLNTEHVTLKLGVLQRYALDWYW